MSLRNHPVVSVKKTTKKSTKAVRQLPPDVVASDLGGSFGDYHYEYLDGQPAGDNPYREGYFNSLTFYKVKDLGWVLLTLHISNPSRRSAAGATARFYGIGAADGKVYTVGRGPHVEAEVVVSLKSANKDRLSRYCDLYREGLETANVIRDRISTRRARGQLRRSYW